jgi:hypothetical protein
VRKNNFEEMNGMDQIEASRKTTTDNVIGVADARPKLSSTGEVRTRRPRVDEMVREFLDLLGTDVEPESFLRTPDGEPFAHIRINGHFENWPLGSTGFRTWEPTLTNLAARHCSTVEK